MASSDFNGDGRSDILWRNNNGQVGTWLIDRNQVPQGVNFSVAGLDWQIQGVGDFNGDGRSDILWRNNNGQVGAWLIDRNQVPQGVNFSVAGLDWQIQGVGDFNGDGRSDILWRNNNGQVGTWLIDRNQVPQGVNFSTAGLDWQIIGSRPFQSPPNQAPTDIQLSNNRLDENVASGTQAGILSAVDPNLADTHTYSVVSGQGDTDNASFRVVGNQLLITESPDFESKSSYSIRLQTTDQNGQSFSKQFTISINDLPEVIPLPVPGLDTWKNNMLTFGQIAASKIRAIDTTLPPEIQHAQVREGGEGRYYDGANAFSQIAEYTNDASWYEISEKANSIYIAFIDWATPLGGVRGVDNFSDGLEAQYARTNDPEARDAIALLATSASYTRFIATGDNLSYPDGPTRDWAFSREVAYGINTLLSAKRVGLFQESDAYFEELYKELGASDDNRIIGPSTENIASRMEDRLGKLNNDLGDFANEDEFGTGLIGFAFGHLKQWFITQDSNDDTFYLKPFMVGLTAKSLIEYVESTPEEVDDNYLSSALYDGLTGMWNSGAWVQESQAFRQIDRIPTDRAKLLKDDQINPEPLLDPAPDLNLLISPAYQWVYQETGDVWFRDRANEIFLGGVQGAFLGSNKQFFENYFWSFEHVTGDFFQT